MLSYRHTFHAGNHADVLKHCVLLHLLDYLTQKDKAFWYIDSHAGAASHDLRSDWAQKNAEFDSGISRLWKEKTLPPALAEYVALIRSFNADVADGALRHYPGSSRIALTKLRAGDRMRLFELHPSESQTLQHFYAGQSRQIQQQVQVQAMDGFDGLRAVLPPAPRRALVLIDPSYEDKNDYARVRSALADAMQRFATGVYLLWYPLVQRREPRLMIDALKKQFPQNWLHVTLTVKAPAEDGFGLHGSGLFVLNPPWTLPGMLKTTLPVLTRLLGQDAQAGWSLDSKIQ